MAKTIFEEMGGTYTQIGDYLLPDLKLPEEEQQSIGGAASPALPEGASTGNLFVKCDKEQIQQILSGGTLVIDIRQYVIFDEL